MNPFPPKPRTGRLPADAVELIAAELRVIAEPDRIRLLEQLSQADATAEELSDRLDATQPTVSEHLMALFDAGLLARKGEGVSARYGLIDTTGWWVIEQIGKAVAGRINARRRYETDQTERRADA